MGKVEVRSPVSHAPLGSFVLVACSILYEGFRIPAMPNFFLHWLYDPG